MSLVTILYRTEEKPVREKINRELNWYDIIKKEMQVFHGGKLIFKYKKDDYLEKMGAEERNKRGIKSTFRLLPEIEDLEIDNHFDMKKITNEDKIEKCIDNYANNNDIDIIVESKDSNGINIEVSEEEVDDFIYEIERRRFKYILL